MQVQLKSEWQSNGAVESSQITTNLGNLLILHAVAFILKSAHRDNSLPSTTLKLLYISFSLIKFHIK